MVIFICLIRGYNHGHKKSRHMAAFSFHV